MWASSPSPGIMQTDILKWLYNNVSKKVPKRLDCKIGLLSSYWGNSQPQNLVFVYRHSHLQKYGSADHHFMQFLYNLSFLLLTHFLIEQRPVQPIICSQILKGTT